MNKATRVLLTAAIALFGVLGFAGVASAGDTEVQGSNCRNEGVAPTEADGGSSTQTNDGNCLNSGDSDGQVDQEGNASSGDGVAGQVAGVVSAGDASVDATNRSDDVDVETGNATGTNDANLDVRAGIGFLLPDGADGDETQGSSCRSEGIAPAEADSSSSQANGSNCVNEGDADGAIGQAADAASGDGVGGQVIGVVTSAGGSADLVLDNESSDSDVNSGDGDFTNTADEFSDAGIFFTIAPD